MQPLQRSVAGSPHAAHDDLVIAVDELLLVCSLAACSSAMSFLTRSSSAGASLSHALLAR